MNEDIRFCVACESIKLVEDAGLLDLTPQDFDFLVLGKPWVANERSRVRQVVEAAVYGTLDYLGLPRFQVPAEFVAASIAYYVHPVNMMVACTVMNGVEWSENIIHGIERPVRAQELFAMVVRIRAGDKRTVEGRLKEVKKRLKV